MHVDRSRPRDILPSTECHSDPYLDAPTCLSLNMHPALGSDIVAMVTMRHLDTGIEWTAVVWRGTRVWRECHGRFEEIAGPLADQLRAQIAAELITAPTPDTQRADTSFARG